MAPAGGGVWAGARAGPGADAGGTAGAERGDGPSGGTSHRGEHDDLRLRLCRHGGRLPVGESQALRHCRQAGVVTT
eukprot:7748486-Pyramimonas_sp.AAC.1